ncbi:alpha/beta-hydrolase [Metschnikowia bicuspidata var. bicuspidata NRRL YB-4993]|uniref:Alpha/beta-hydrolase n=1 Tax=Metschnikowia bicuspidata var. bicuspidata NRRL YB-4993 TaxID=869754 RepID=A0A1A0HIC8_9ASCO|nr:alpha/beta-hydrolase [Metschnikowia bicuspidata var. bicuspidata NRRL YB-4993]OBA23760.1 alpha/beta-hydrolase [Metschnikowia bicuspidata var. bicuspidata NRRL YB-4993]
MLCSVRTLGTARARGSAPGAAYQPNRRVVKKLLFVQQCAMWLRSLRPGHLATLQRQLVEWLFPAGAAENQGVARDFVQTPVDARGSVVNSVVFLVQNDKAAETRHVVFVHGYGAALGCFARNFHVINRFKGLRHNYKVHFLDNLSFGLSSNPRVASLDYWRPVPRVDFLTMHDAAPTVKAGLHRKYYKLIAGYEVDAHRFGRYKAAVTPVLRDLEAYYTDALEAWRVNARIGRIHFLVGHSFGGYWCGSYALRHPDSVRHLVLLSPVGVERHAAAVTAPAPRGLGPIAPSLDPASPRFLSRWPILAARAVRHWYYVQPYLPRLLRLMGPWGVARYYDMWSGKLFAVNGVIARLGGAAVLTSSNQLRYGTNTECRLLIEYLYNSVTAGSRSDIHIKYLLTPATDSKWPLMDKFARASGATLAKFRTHVVYGQYDYMNSEAGEKMVAEMNGRPAVDARFHVVPEAGHNLYLQNPFGTNALLERLVREAD